MITMPAETRGPDVDKPPAQVTTSAKGWMVRSMIWGQPVFFTITQPRDAIQKKHRQGRFYESEELEIIRRYFKPGSVFVDIGSNIGNHELFALKFLYASRAILFEPNPTAIAVLRSNIEMNGLEDRCDMSFLGYGLSDVAAEGMTMDVPLGNLGGGRMVAGEGAQETRRGDDLLGDTPVHFIKIDVEGMEMQVLAGLSRVIAACRPAMFIEVDNENAADFETWVRDNGYAVQAKHKRYRSNRNFLITPRLVPRQEAKD